MRKSKRWLAFLATVAMLLGLTAALPLAAEEEDGAQHLSMAKTEFYEDEVIEIVATGDPSNKDWVGYNVDGNTGNSVKWWYITEENAGQPVNLLTGKPAAEGDTGLPAGKYWAYFVPANGYAYTMTETVSFVVKKRPVDPEDVISAKRPDGDGSYVYPYLISSAENLAWMAEQIGSGLDPIGKDNPFAGKYFRQTCDIDLGGRILNPIGYAYLSEDAYAVFGGMYDGQGYTIRNGRIRDAEGNGASLQYGTGLFGVIYDAEIRNVVLEDLDVSGAAVVGALVGAAYTDTADVSAADRNLIEKCTVGAGCTVTAETKNTDKSDYGAPQRIGGLIGMGMAITVNACINEGTVKANYGIKTSGGIMGGADSFVTITDCVNKGKLEMDCTGGILSPEGYQGGILGYIYQTAKGDHLIENCYNAGGMQILTNPDTAAFVISLGGIIGAVNTLAQNYTHEIRNCYNLTETVSATPNANSWNWRIGEIAGCGYQAANAAATPLRIRDCYAVGMPIATTTLTVDGVETTYRAVTWYWGYPHNTMDTKDADGNVTEPAGTVYPLGNFRNNLNAEGTVELVFTDCGYKTTEELRVFTDAIDEAIENTVSEPTVNRRVLTDRKMYFVGEDIFVYGTGDAAAKDWIGIRPKDDTGNSIYWYYITEENQGKPVNIREQKTSSRPDAADYTLPAGEYLVYYVPANGYAKDMTEYVEIRITESVAADRDEYMEGESIFVRGKTENAANKDWIGIRPLDDPDPKGNSIYWYYLTDDNNMKPVDLRTGQASSRADVNDYNLPAGVYSVFFVPANGYAGSATENVVIRILEEGDSRALEAPLNVVYTLENDTDGMADGTLKVMLPADTPAKDIVMYWGDENGKLEGYTALARFRVTGSETVREMTPNTIIPTGATRLLVYTASGGTLSEECFTVELPEGAAHGAFGTVIREFQVISDIHLNTDNADLYNQNFRKVLQDIAANSTGSDGIYIVGDITNTGKTEEYANLWTIYHEVRADATLPEMYLAIGNHDFFGNSSYQASVDLFLANAGLPGGGNAEELYYDFWKDGYHYIFLGSDRYPINNVNAYLNSTQLAWLEEKLAENRDVNKPTFVFLHQSLSNTVAGSFDGQGWNGATPEKGLRDVLKKYPEVILFNGHSHWTLDSDGCMYERDGDLPTIFNTASTAYLWTSYNKTAGEALAGSQGYYVRVYEDRVAVFGRDFSTGEWIPSALFVADYSDMSPYQPQDTPDSGTDTSDATVTTAETPTDPVPQDTQEPAPAPAGCASSVGAGSMVLICLAAGVACFRKKRKDD